MTFVINQNGKRKSNFTDFYGAIFDFVCFYKKFSSTALSIKILLLMYLACLKIVKWEKTKRERKKINLTECVTPHIKTAILGSCTLKTLTFWCTALTFFFFDLVLVNASLILSIFKRTKYFRICCLYFNRSVRVVSLFVCCDC